MQIKRFFIIAGLIMAMCGLLFLGTTQAETTETKENQADQTVKVLSFNIRYGSANDGKDAWPTRTEQVTEIMQAGKYDFIGLQECLIHPDATKNQLTFLTKQLADNYNVIGISREADPENGESMAVFYRKDRWVIDPEEQGTFWLSESPTEAGSKSWDTACTRTVTWGRFTDKKTGKSVYYYNTHFDHVSKLAQEHSAIMVIEHMSKRKHKDEPFFLTGDFNASEKSMPIRYLSGQPVTFEGKDIPAQKFLKDTYREVHPDTVEETTHHGFTGITKPGSKIDYIFASPDVKTLESTVIKTNKDGKYPSDHFPIDGVYLIP